MRTTFSLMVALAIAATMQAQNKMVQTLSFSGVKNIEALAAYVAEYKMEPALLELAADHLQSRNLPEATFTGQKTINDLMMSDDSKFQRFSRIMMLKQNTLVKCEEIQMLPETPLPQAKKKSGNKRQKTTMQVYLPPFR